MVEVGLGEPTWMDPIFEFMKDGVRPEDRRQARKLQSRCVRYTLMNGKLYRRGYSFPNLKCVTEEEREVIMGEIHERVCGNHSGSRSLAHKALRTRFFWPNMGAMADKMSARCHKWHLHANEIHSPPIYRSVNTTVALAFCTVGFRSHRDTVKDTKAVQIRCPGDNHHGQLNTIQQYHLIEFTKEMSTKMVFASVAHSQTNGQVEAVNKIIKKLLKKKQYSKKRSVSPPFRFPTNRSIWAPTRKMAT
uniref:uncharacterized protein LOC105350140 n=1 Tax=Fragaria vesca subsp. vesca TaxID=101020 RepID=UPI0005CA1370|nr:PREDICTED: uncharacterized protein LOC105350140 [Fragaria vesca subsp. vesca]